MPPPHVVPGAWRIPTRPWTFDPCDLPVVAVGLHGGHLLSPEVAALLAIDEETRRRVETPEVARWCERMPGRIQLHVSRFQVDMDRAREHAIYVDPADAWGLDVWTTLPPRRTYEAALELYDLFHEQVTAHVASLIGRFGHVAVLHVCAGDPGGFGELATAAPTPAPAGPVRERVDIEVHTGGSSGSREHAVAERLATTLRSARFDGAERLVRCSDVPRGEGHFTPWLRRTFGDAVCALTLSVRVRRGTAPDARPGHGLDRPIGHALASSVPALLEALE